MQHASQSQLMSSPNEQDDNIHEETLAATGSTVARFCKLVFGLPMLLYKSDLLALPTCFVSHEPARFGGLEGRVLL